LSSSRLVGVSSVKEHCADRQCCGGVATKHQCVLRCAERHVRCLLTGSAVAQHCVAGLEWHEAGEPICQEYAHQVLDYQPPDQEPGTDVSGGKADCADPSGAQVQGNPRDLERALRNLVGNGLRHCERKVHISARMNDANVVITVADDGPGIAAEDEERIFQRFVRLDEARTRDAGGSGLGLAIASEIAANHGGSIRLDHSPTPGATFELILPK
jgi:signal transduction histidine kinase